MTSTPIQFIITWPLPPPTHTLNSTELSSRDSCAGSPRVQSSLSYHHSQGGWEVRIQEDQILNSAMSIHRERCGWRCRPPEGVIQNILPGNGLVRFHSSAGDQTWNYCARNVLVQIKLCNKLWPSTSAVGKAVAKEESLYTRHQLEGNVQPQFYLDSLKDGSPNGISFGNNKNGAIR